MGYNIFTHKDLGIGALIEQLSDDNEIIRLDAVEYLGDIGPGASAALPRLKELAETEEADFVLKAVSDAIEKIEGDDTTETN